MKHFIVKYIDNDKKLHQVDFESLAYAKKYCNVLIHMKERHEIVDFWLQEVMDNGR